MTEIEADPVVAFERLKTAYAAFGVNVSAFKLNPADASADTPWTIETPGVSLRTRASGNILGKTAWHAYDALMCMARTLEIAAAKPTN